VSYEYTFLLTRRRSQLGYYKTNRKVTDSIPHQVTGFFFKELILPATPRIFLVIREVSWCLRLRHHMWAAPLCLTTVWTSTACERDSFSFLLYTEFPLRFHIKCKSTLKPCTTFHYIVLELPYGSWLLQFHLLHFLKKHGAKLLKVIPLRVCFISLRKAIATIREFVCVTFVACGISSVL
jgi:hypothetical protein